MRNNTFFFFFFLTQHESELEPKKRDAHGTLIYICNEIEDGLLMMQRAIKEEEV